MNVMITGAGVYDMAEDVYHADPVPGGSLSCSGAKKLLPPSCPARYAYDREHPEPKRHFELGSAAHRLVLGLGVEWVLIDAPDYRTKAAQQARDEARAAGAAPLLSPEYEQIKAMAAAIRAHPLASALLCDGDVQAEQSFFWQDQDYGIWRRARLDTTRHPRSSRLLITDYKTCASADPEQFAKAAANYRYHMQDVWYRAAVAACLGATDAAFLFVAQEKAAPYLVTVCELDADALRAGAGLAGRAMEIYRDCTISGVWPGYQPENEITLITLPPWATRQAPALEIA